MNLKSDEVIKFEDDLRGVENTLAELGRRICSVEGGATSWNAINKAIEAVQDAIHNAYYMDKLRQ